MIIVDSNFESFFLDRLLKKEKVMEKFIRNNVIVVVKEVIFWRLE